MTTTLGLQLRMITKLQEKYIPYPLTTIKLKLTTTYQKRSNTQKLQKFKYPMKNYINSSNATHTYDNL